MAYMGESRSVYRVLVHNLKEKDNVENLGIDRRII